MSSPASVGKHPIHPMLVVFPIGLWVFSFICDLIFRFGTHNPIWSDVARYCIAGGIVGAVLAAVPGLIDFLSLTEARAKRIGLFHMLLNVCALLLFAFNFYLRLANPEAAAPVLLSFITILALGVSGWLGGELVYVHGVGVDQVSPTEEHPLRKAG